MPEPVRVDITASDEITGSGEYTVAITLTNVGPGEVTGVQVQPQVLPGKLVTRQIELRESEEPELQSRRRALIEEMQMQVTRAYEREVYRKMNPVDRFMFSLIRAVDVYAAVFSGRRGGRLVPSWTNEAFTIDDWHDVEILESEIIALEPEGSKLRRAFVIDKGKLERCLAGIAAQSETPVKLDSTATLSPGSSITFPFVARAPHQLRRRVVDLQFKIMFREQQAGRHTSQSITKRITIFPSAFAVPTGGVVGALCGQAIRAALGKANLSVSFDFPTFIGTALLGLVVTLLTSRKPETYKIITVEDFFGGFLLGALTGLFNEAAMEKLRLLFTGPRTG